MAKLLRRLSENVGEVGLALITAGGALLIELPPALKVLSICFFIIAIVHAAIDWRYPSWPATDRRLGVFKVGHRVVAAVVVFVPLVFIALYVALTWVPTFINDEIRGLVADDAIVHAKRADLTTVPSSAATWMDPARSGSTAFVAAQVKSEVRILPCECALAEITKPTTEGLKAVLIALMPIVIFLLLGFVFLERLAEATSPQVPPSGPKSE